MARQNQGGASMDQFEAFFRRADLDQDGRISGAEAVTFFQGSNLPKQVLAQIWMHADQSRSGYLGRPDFYNALKLVTVAQSKRELTPDIVKAALYGPASAKIPAPQINLAAIPMPQVNPMAASPAQQMGVVAPTSSQNIGLRGQVSPNVNINQQYFQSQGTQSIRSPLPVPTSTASRPLQGIGGLDPSRGGGVVGSGLSNSNATSDWLAGRTTGASIGVTSEVSNRRISPSLSTPVSTLQDSFSNSSLMTVKDPKASISSGNGFGIDSMFGGDVFSAKTLPKQATTVSMQAASSVSAPSAIVSETSGPKPAIIPETAGSQPAVKPDPFQNTFTRQVTGGQSQQIQSLQKPNHPVSALSNSSLVSSGLPVQVGASIPDQSQPPWPKMTRPGVQKYMKVFVEVDTDRDGRITGEQASKLFLSWRLPREVLKQVWDLSDQDNDGMLSLREFCIALYLMERYREGRSLPPTLPNSVLLDEALLSVTGPPSTAYGTAGWGPITGLRPQQGMPGAQSSTPTGFRPPVQPISPQAEGTMQFNQQKPILTSVEYSHMNQLSNGDQNTLDSNSHEATETEKKEKVIMDSREKLEFYRTKMQDLVLYKSRCDNRLNEITERALADKREAELLAKKYEEKYKQVAEIASKLTIEEASFRDIQERKTELHQAIIKMEQGGSADGLLQVRADRIQSDLEELLKALTERCKKHGLNVKSATVVELPAGWQPGIPVESTVWDEDWDKFEDEGFSFDVFVHGSVKSSSLQKENSSPNGSPSPDLMSNADGRSERTYSKGEHDLETELSYTHSEDESLKSPPVSPGRQTAFESLSHDYSDNQSRKSFEAETDIHRSFDEPWGTFDNNDDTESIWGFNPAGGKDVHEKHGEKYFFESGDLGISPVRTESPHADTMFKKKSPFFEDSVPSTPLSRADNSPSRHSGGSLDPFFDNFSRYDSFSTHEHGFSPRRETLTRFDSVNSTRSFDHSRGYSFDDTDPFGSSGPFKVLSDNQTPRKGSADNWSSF